MGTAKEEQSGELLDVNLIKKRFVYKWSTK